MDPPARDEIIRARHRPALSPPIPVNLLARRRSPPLYRHHGQLSTSSPAPRFSSKTLRDTHLGPRLPLEPLDLRLHPQTPELERRPKLVAPRAPQLRSGARCLRTSPSSPFPLRASCKTRRSFVRPRRRLPRRLRIVADRQALARRRLIPRGLRLSLPDAVVPIQLLRPPALPAPSRSAPPFRYPLSRRDILDDRTSTNIETRATAPRIRCSPGPTAPLPSEPPERLELPRHAAYSSRVPHARILPGAYRAVLRAPCFLEQAHRVLGPLPRSI